MSRHLRLSRKPRLGVGLYGLIGSDEKGILLELGYLRVLIADERVRSLERRLWVWRRRLARVIAFGRLAAESTSAAAVAMTAEIVVLSVALWAGLRSRLEAAEARFRAEPNPVRVAAARTDARDDRAGPALLEHDGTAPQAPSTVA